MILFPIAFVWLVCFLVWLIRHSPNEIDTPPEAERRWRRPRTPRPPRNGRPTLDRGGRRRSRAAA